MLINRTKQALTLKVVDASGKEDSVNLQPSGRLTLPPGYELHPNYVKVYEASVIDTDKTVQSTLA